MIAMVVVACIKERKNSEGEKLSIQRTKLST
jgi:hypothetical protein